MISIKISELKEFLKRSSNIKDAGIIPIYSYIKLETTQPGVVKLTKSNQRVFIQHTIEADFKKPFAVLLDQKILTAAVNQSDDAELVISKKADMIYLSDGKMKLEYQLGHGETPELFPAVQAKDSESHAVFFDSDVIEAIALAHIHCEKNSETPGPNTFVNAKHLDAKRSYIYGMNGIIFYCKTFGFKLPLLQLSEEACAIISRFPSAEYYQTERYDIFDVGNTVYGFIKPDTATVDITAFFERLSGKEFIFSVTKKEIVKFCDFAADINQGILANSSVEPTNEGVLFRYENIPFGRYLDLPVVTKNFSTFERFYFKSQQLSLSVKHLPYDVISVHKRNNTYVLTSDEDPNYFSAIQAVAKTEIEEKKPKKEAATA